MTGSLSPYAQALGVSVERAGDAPVLRMRFAEKLVGRPNFLHGGAIAGLLEAAALAALEEALAGSDATGAKPVTITVDYMRGGRDRDTHAAGRVARLGTRIANIEAQAWQDDPETPIASARITFVIDRPEPPAA